MYKVFLSIIGLIGVSSAIASVPPTTYTGGVIGKVVMYGDFPSDTSAFGWYQVPIAHGDDGYADTLGTIHLAGLTSVGSAIDYAELTINVHSYTTAPAVPGFRVYARKATSPTAPTSGTPSTYPSTYYSGGSGWTTSYVAFAPVNNDTGVHRLDVTDLVNELAGQTGGTGTSVTFILEPTHTPDGVSPVTIRFTGNPSLKIYSDLDDRDYQRKAIAGGKTIFFLPLDATDLGSNGSTVNNFRVVVAGSTDGVDQTTTTSEATLEGISRTANFALEITTPVTELVDNDARKLVAPYNSGQGDYLWPILTSTHSYLLLTQFVHNGLRNGFMWDTYSEFGFQMYVSEGTEDATFSSNSPSPGYVNVVSLPAAYRNISGEVKTICVYYDADADKMYVGYHNGESNTPMTWTSGQSASGLNQTLYTSGLWFGDGLKFQAVAAFDWSSTRRVAEIKSSVERARALWSSGIKSLPPMLFD